MPDILSLTADEKLVRLNVKLEWAKKHFSKLQAVSERFLTTDPKPYAVGFDHDSQPGQTLIYLLKDAEPTPTEIGLLAGDVAHNLRSVLDHLAYYLWVVGTNGKGIPGRKRPFGKAYFPIADDANEYQTSGVGKVEGMTDDAKKAVAETEPYYGGKGHIFWLLNQLDIADKHHTLVTSDIRPLSMNMDFARFPIRARYPGMNQGFVLRYARFGNFTFPGFRTSAKAGDVIISYESKTYKDVQPTFDIAFSEPQVIEGKSVLITLQYAIDAIDNLLPKFRPLLV